MARTRNLKPSFFTNEQLADLPPLTRLFFQGLWLHADREGRLEDRARKLKAEILPYDECDIDALLAELNDAKFIERYEVGGVRYIFLPTFVKHQNPHPKEPESLIPPPPDRGKKRLSRGKKRRVPEKPEQEMPPLNHPIPHASPSSNPHSPTPPPTRARANGQGGVKSRSKFSFDQALEWARTEKGVKDPPKFAQKAIETGKEDDRIGAYFRDHPKPKYSNEEEIARYQADKLKEKT